MIRPWFNLETMRGPELHPKYCYRHRDIEYRSTQQITLLSSSYTLVEVEEEEVDDDDIVILIDDDSLLLLLLLLWLSLLRFWK